MAHGQGGAEIVSGGTCAGGFRTEPGEHLVGCQAAESGQLVAHTLRAEGFDASEDGTGRGTPLVPVAFSSKDDGRDAGEISPTLRSMNFDKSHSGHDTGGGVPFLPVDAEPFIFQTRIGRNGRGQPKELADALTSSEGGTRADSKPHVVHGLAVRRLTPRECERLQAFPDDWTRYGHDGKEISDSARYRMLGNAVTVSVISWIGRRIVAISEGREP